VPDNIKSAFMADLPDNILPVSRTRLPDNIDRAGAGLQTPAQLKFLIANEFK